MTFASRPQLHYIPGSDAHAPSPTPPSRAPACGAPGPGRGARAARALQEARRAPHRGAGRAQDLAQPLRHEDIEGVYAGLRPLLQGESDATSQLSREHAVSQSVSGLITVAGGKYTTYRVMAKDVVDVAARGLEQKVPPSCTHETPLVGAAGYRAHWNRREALAEERGGGGL